MPPGVQPSAHVLDDDWQDLAALDRESTRSLWLVSPDCDLVLSPPRLHEIIGGLASQPELGIGPACLFEADRHFGRDARVAIENPG